MRDKPRRSHASTSETPRPTRYRATWASAVVALAFVLVTPVVLWAIARPVQVATLVVVLAVSHALARAVHEADGGRFTAGRRALAKAVDRVTPN